MKIGFHFSSPLFLSHPIGTTREHRGLQTTVPSAALPRRPDGEARPLLDSISTDFAAKALLAGTISLVDEADIGDHFWHNHENRRKIRLGLWKLASFSDDWVSRRLQERLPHTPKFDEALDPHIVELRKLILWPQDYNRKLVPCKTANLGVMRPNQAPLTLTEHAMLNNWLHDKLCRHPTLYLETFCDAGAVRVHTITLLVAYWLKRDGAPGLDTSDEIAVRRHAWEIQKSGEEETAGHDHLLNDITRRAVADLEALMFDERLRAGRAGVRQWGLDAGYHQNNWSPYKDFVGEQDPVRVAEKWEEEIQPEWNDRGLNYIAWKEPETPQKPRTRPMPRQSIPGQETPSRQDSAAKWKQQLFREYWGMDIAIGDVEMVGHPAASTDGDGPPPDLDPTPPGQLDEELSELTELSDWSDTAPQPAPIAEPIVEVRRSARVEEGQAVYGNCRRSTMSVTSGSVGVTGELAFPAPCYSSTSQSAFATMDLPRQPIFSEDSCTLESQKVLRLYSSKDVGKRWLEENEIVFVKGSVVALWPQIVSLAREKNREGEIVGLVTSAFELTATGNTYRVT
ncbi:hypothetical protein NP233_g11518 [Leucocoprinus birnbaumii]|uniref:Uncharacterized protein n=1 Tax=Leucocoprinus birnbaumii TaxID=56174 RepID=A0AAD5YKB9_9AGAR|nr:hypothetical protein NP233_g11518 [Leucocoprinus birnbaumii]